MASTYFTKPSFARAKKNKEDLEKTNPKEPVLNDEDEKFLEKISSADQAAPTAGDNQPTKIADDGEKQTVSAEQAQNDGSTDQVAVPDTKPEEDDKNAESGDVQDPPESVPEQTSNEPAPTSPKTKKAKKNKGVELPSQEDAEAATRGFASHTQAAQDKGDDKKTWASYLSSSVSSIKKDSSAESKKDQTAESKQSDNADKDARTWAQYASTYVPSSLPSMPSLPASWSRGKDAKVEPVYNEDGSVNEEATKEKQEKEVSVLLDNLHLSSINNRVFSFSQESQKFYERFTQVLKDVMNGAPTAYDDMEKLMKDAGPTLERQYNSMPPFVQTLVKTLPAKLGTTLGPELMAAASEKPGNDAKARMEAASKQAEKRGDPSIQPQGEKTPQGKKTKKVPGMKGLVKQQGMVATILRNIVNFLRVRFPFLLSATNVVMSLAVFILMFVFYYCWKRGRETRLAGEAEKGGEENDDELEIEVTDDDEEDEENQETEPAPGDEASIDKAKLEALNKPAPAQVPLPESKSDEKSTSTEADTK